MQKNKACRYSIIMPVYNSESTIAEALDAIFKLNGDNWEVIVFDDGSNDGTIGIIKKYPCRIIQSETNAGPAAGRNRGAAQASGEILVFVDSDVIVPPNTIELLDKMFYGQDADAIIGVYSPHLRYHDFASNYKNIYQYYTYGFLPELKNIPNFCSSLAAVKKTVFDDIGGYDENYKTACIEDTEFGERIAVKYKLYSCRELEFEHVKHYTAFQVLKTDFIRAGSTMKLMLRRQFHDNEKYNPRSIQKAYTSLQKSYIYGIILTAMVLLFLLCGFFIYPVFFLIALLAYCVIIIINHKFIKLILKELTIVKFKPKNKFIIFIKSCLFLFIDLFTMGLGIFTSIPDYMRGKKY